MLGCSKALANMLGWQRRLSLPAALHAAQRAGIKVTQRPILRFIRPEGRHVAPMWVKCGAKFHLHRYNNKGTGLPKLKFLLRFDQNVEYKRPAGPYPLRDFYKFYRVCSPFQDALAVKILLDLLKGLWSYGGFKLS